MGASIVTAAGGGGVGDVGSRGSCPDGSGVTGSSLTSSMVGTGPDGPTIDEVDAVVYFARRVTVIVPVWVNPSPPLWKPPPIAT